MVPPAYLREFLRPRKKGFLLPKFFFRMFLFGDVAGDNRERSRFPKGIRRGKNARRETVRGPGEVDLIFNVLALVSTTDPPEDLRKMAVGGPPEDMAQTAAEERAWFRLRIFFRGPDRANRSAGIELQHKLAEDHG